MLVFCGYSSNHSGKIPVNQSGLKKKNVPADFISNFHLRFVFMSEEIKSDTSLDVSSLERVELQQLGLTLTSSVSIVLK